MRARERERAGDRDVSPGVKPGVIWFTSLSLSLFVLSHFAPRDFLDQYSTTTSLSLVAPDMAWAPSHYTPYYQIRHEMQKWQRGEDKRLDNSVVNLVYRGVVVVAVGALNAAAGAWGQNARCCRVCNNQLAKIERKWVRFLTLYTFSCENRR